MGRCRATVFKDVTSRCSKRRPGWRLTNKDKLCHAMVLVVHVTWMSVLLPLCYCLFRSHEEQIIRPASDCLHIYWVTIGNARPEDQLFDYPESMWLYSAAPGKKSQAGQLTDCQGAWKMRQEWESMWLVSEYGPSAPSQNRMGLSWLMTCICKNICPYSKGSGTTYTVNGTMHASIWKSKMCLAAKSYETTLSPPVYCWLGNQVPTKLQRK